MYKFFPALLSPNSQILNNIIYCDNAGGSQVPVQVINKVTDMITNYYVQPYSNNNISRQLTHELDIVYNNTNILLNNKKGKIVYGSSTSQLVYNLANSMKKNFDKVGGDIILADFNHESMLSPFERIENYNDNKREYKNTLSIKWWKLRNNTENDEYIIDYNNLYNLINNKNKTSCITTCE